MFVVGMPKDVPPYYQRLVLETLGGRQIEMHIDQQDDKGDLEIRIFDDSNEIAAMLIDQKEILRLRRFLEGVSLFTMGGKPREPQKEIEKKEKKKKK